MLNTLVVKLNENFVELNRANFQSSKYDYYICIEFLVELNLGKTYC